MPYLWKKAIIIEVGQAFILTGQQSRLKAAAQFI
jgi:hypothetical protein